jgi:hypothetical protein
VTDVSTKGLLPQLTDVLRALTDSHALLLSKIQNVRLEQISAVYPVVEVHGEFSRSQVDLPTQSIVSTTTSPIIEVPEAVRHEAGTGASSSQIDSSEFEMSSGAHLAATDDTDHMMTSPSPAAAEVATPHDDSVPSVSAGWALPPDEREAQQEPATDVDSENRDYNFFDELDARIAGLGDEESTEDR